MKKKYYLFSIAAIIVYILTIISGDILAYNKYNPLINVVSAFQLYMTNAKFIYIYLGFIIYNMLLTLFCIYAIKYLKKFSKCFIPIINTVMSSLIYIFPMSERNAKMTTNGIIHLSLSIICILCIIIFMIMFTKQSYKSRKNKFFSYIFLTLTILFILFSIITAFGALNIIKYFGLFQRIMIYNFLIFIFVLSLMIKSKST